MKIIHTSLPEVLLIQPTVHEDERGFFKETWHEDRYRKSGIARLFVQDNFSRSCQGTLRGLHFQIQQPQAKFVQVTMGEIFDVVVDLRRSSPTFGLAATVTLSAENHSQLFIPEGFAHGFYVLSKLADVYYKCSNFYASEHERTLLWNDPDLNIDWPLTASPIISEKDQQGTTLQEIECFE